MKFSKEFLVDIVYGNCPDGFVKLEDTILETSRWSILHLMVFNFDDKYYQSSYRVGATEQQDEQPYMYDGDGEGMVECVEVVLKKVETIVYEPVI